MYSTCTVRVTVTYVDTLTKGVGRVIVCGSTCTASRVMYGFQVRSMGSGDLKKMVISQLWDRMHESGLIFVISHAPALTLY